jgi:lysophospholipase L1-like esterase
MQTPARKLGARLIIGVGCCALVAAGCSGVGDADSQAVAPGLTIFMIGDSTMADKPLAPPQPERGWGQMLPLYFESEVRIENFALNGRSSKSFRDEGHWQTVVDRIRPGDYVIIQFGHNDEKIESPARYADPFVGFKENLERYVSETRALGGKPILATSIVRRKFGEDGMLEDTHGDYVLVPRIVARELNVPLLELNGRSEALINRLGPELSKRMFMWIEPGEYDSVPMAVRDDTHLNSVGAARIADLAADEIRAALPALAQWLK